MSRGWEVDCCSFSVHDIQFDYFTMYGCFDCVECLIRVMWLPSQKLTPDESSIAVLSQL